MLCDMWNLPGPGIESVSSALVGISPASIPPGKYTNRICEKPVLEGKYMDIWRAGINPIAVTSIEEDTGDYPWLGGGQAWGDPFIASNATFFLFLRRNIFSQLKCKLFWREYQLILFWLLSGRLVRTSSESKTWSQKKKKMRKSNLKRKE